jgi:hypothetical protein
VRTVGLQNGLNREGNHDSVSTIPAKDDTAIPDQFGQDCGNLCGVSVPVSLDELQEKSAEFGWAYLLTVRDDLRPHAVAVSPTWADGALVMAVGRGSALNATARPSITLCFPPVDGTGFSLIVDGTAAVEGDVVTLTPTAAVLHRPAT